MRSVLAASEVSAERIDALVAEFAAITEPGPGVTRLAYSRAEREAHAAFAGHMRRLGLSVRTDAAGNTIAELTPVGDGKARGIGTGSHLDSVPAGGRFDGTAGVIAAIEVATVAVRTGLSISRPWRFIAFAAEEGARFGQACNGSRLAAGLTTADETGRFRDSAGLTMRSAMTAAGLRPDQLDEARWDPADWLAFVELHIEQGRMLEEHGCDIGVVETISGSTRLLATVTGEASHTGGTPMSLRKDALVTAAECVLACDAIARDAGHHGTRVTVGRMTVEPGSMTTIPGRVVFTVDIRDVDGERQHATEAALAEEFRGISRRRGTGMSLARLADTPPVALPEIVSSQIIAAAKATGTRYRVMPSGASHDAQQVNHIVPAGMVFVPSHAGLSHVPEEHTTAQQVATGTRILLDAMIRLDRRP
ncbi:MAG TPA: Zn-dependent hydrolase [Trebonia sp.]|nr:Zn-dependent hydrolase [Trebonia sp.]